MRRLLVIFGGFIVLLATASAAFIGFRGPILEAALEFFLRDAGFETADVDVASISLNRLVLSKVEAGPDAGAPAAALENVDVEYDLASLVRARRARAVTIGPGRIMIVLSEDGRLSAPGLAPSAGASPETAGPPLELPLDRLAVKNLSVIVETPRGPARALLNGEADGALNGEWIAEATADAAGLSAFGVSDAAGRIAVRLADEASIEATVTGNADLAEARVSGLDVTVDGELSQWRKVAAADRLEDVIRDIDARVELAIRSASLTAETVGGDVDGDFAAGLPGGPIREAMVRGAVRATITPDATIVSLPEGPLTLTTDRGDTLTLSGPVETGGDPDSAPLFIMSEDGQSIDLRLALSGPSPASGRLTASSEDGETWRIDVLGRAREQQFGSVSLNDSEIGFIGFGDRDRIRGVVSGSGAIKSAAVGRMLIQDATAQVEAPLDLSLSGKTIAIGDVEDGCATFDKGRIQIVAQDLAASVWDARICARMAPLVVAEWGDAPHVDAGGRLTARRGFFRLGQSVFSGAPPTIDLSADYDPAAERTRARAEFAGGAVDFNKTLRFSRAKGEAEALLEGPDLSADVTLQSARISQVSEAPTAAPILAAGAGRLEDDRFGFSFNASTVSPSGRAGFPLGSGRGVHQVETGRGFAEFNADGLTFSPGGLQPTDLTPLTKGVVFDADGVVDALFRFDWDPTAVRSSGDIEFADLSFGGPGLAVTATRGVRGAVSLTSLLPPATDGEQRIDIRLVDLDALKLENGVVRFALPGDDTLEVVHAEFPWFGGTIGAYDTVTPMSGGEARTVLRAANVDLGELLAFVKVDGLSGEGAVEGVLPVVVEDGLARIEGGELRAVGPGVIRYTGAVSAAASASDQNSKLAFNALRELRYETLSATIDGRLDGDLVFGVRFDGSSTVALDDPRITEPVELPFIYRINIKAPLLRLIEQANLRTNIQMKLEDLAGEAEAARRAGGRDEDGSEP